MSLESVLSASSGVRLLMSVFSSSASAFVRTFLSMISGSGAAAAASAFAAAYYYGNASDFNASVAGGGVRPLICVG